MPEAVLVMLDNSAYSINGDYYPTRWSTQIDAASFLIQAKMDTSHETAMGVGLLAGQQVQIVCTPTTDSVKAAAYLYGIKQSGRVRLCQAMQIGALALKHRVNATLRQRIICFIASTIQDSLQELKIICKKLKKNNIAMDIVALGDLTAAQMDKINAIIELISQDGNSKAIFVSPDSNLCNTLIEAKLIDSKIASINNNMESEEDELARALQLSLEEYQNRAGQSQAQELERQALRLSLQGQNMQQEKDPEQKKKQ